MKEVSTGKGFISGFDWKLHPSAEKVLFSEVKHILKNSKFAKHLAKAMLRHTSTELYDWIDHIVIPTSRISRKGIIELGFKENRTVRTRPGVRAYRNDATVFFPVLLDSEERYEIAIKTDNIEAATRKLGKKGKIIGEKYSPVRKAILAVQGRFVVSAIERRGSQDFVVPDRVSDDKAYKRALTAFSQRKRNFTREWKGIEHTRDLVRKHLRSLKPERVADAFFRCERDFWMTKNRAGKIQHTRQNKLGLGWGNHDHHTYRASRKHFAALVHIFELMGYKCRERFYAGEKAGWGAQILEHPKCDIVVFADVDITKAEKDKDFAHKGLDEQTKLGTVGLWSGLHGESIVRAGMHHLEARFSFKKLNKDLHREGIKVMKPFSNFKFLKQAFTQGERWKVDPKRAKRLLADKSITVEQYNGFIARGAIGSHLENLQRRQGYKGFNQDSVTSIIKAVNPVKRLLSNDVKGA